MRPELIIMRAHQRGVKLNEMNRLIEAYPKTRLTPELRKLIRRYRSDVVEYLAKPEPEYNQQRFLELIGQTCTDNAINPTDNEILAELDTDGIEELKTATLETRLSWATAIGLRIIRHHGFVPTGWTKIAHCYFCGPVHSYLNLNMLSCQWCEMREAGKSFPQPSSEEQAR
jgi:hypothetical protein